MAKKGMIERNNKRVRMVAQYAARRAELKRVLSDPATTDEQFYAAQRKLTKLPRNSSAVRLRNRCSITGRPRAYLRKYGVSRITFRELASEGKIPGVTKSSW
ncbi:MAG TPA: 30S ribosomal protein S14 [Oceanipulchritudo sp.]|nr:30S ribosomal protein S14 [Oceanipulchritudo sp.]